MTPYDDLKARAQKALDNDDWGTLKALFVAQPATYTPPSVDPHGGPPPPPPPGS